MSSKVTAKNLQPAAKKMQPAFSENAACIILKCSRHD